MFANQGDVSRRILAESQDGPFPYTMTAMGLALEVHAHVFSPKHFHGWEVFTRAFPDVRGQDVLEVGCGTGVTAVYLASRGAARVLAVDINPWAVENTRRNAAINRVTQVEARHSDIFSAVRPDESFDAIYWNVPFMPEDEQYVYKDVLERALFDPGYRLIERYLAQAAQFLRPGGYLLAGLGDFADLDRFRHLCDKYGWTPSLLVTEASAEGNPVTFDLYELRR